MDPRGPLGSPHAKREPPFALGVELSKARSIGCDSSLLLWLLLCAPQQRFGLTPEEGNLL